MTFWFISLLLLNPALSQIKLPKVTELQVTCRLSQDCILPCSFPPSGSSLVLWYRQGELLLASNTSETNDKNRTSLTQEQLAKGNASLRLSSCTLRDRGRYSCRVNASTGEHLSLVTVRVEAPAQSVSLRVSEKEPLELICSSQQVYPSPRVSWHTNPPSSPSALKSSTRISSDQQGRYSISSTLSMMGHQSGLTYICNISTVYGSHSWTTSIHTREIYSSDTQVLFLPCVAPKPLHNFTLSWTYTSALEPSLILTYDSRTGALLNRWGEQVQLERHMAHTGDATLQLRTAHKAGMYSCIVSGSHTTHQEHTYIRTAEKRSGGCSRLWIVGLVFVTLVVCGGALVLYAKRKGVFCSWKAIPEADESSGAREHMELAHAGESGDHVKT